MVKWIVCFAFVFGSVVRGENHKFVILIASYNNEAYCEHNLKSALTQDYENYRVIFINDASTDNTLTLALSVVQQLAKEDLITIIDNPVRRRALANHYEAIHHYIQDDEIVVILDGDDALDSTRVLKILDRYYTNHDIWLTYGQFRYKSNRDMGWCRPMPQHIVDRKAFRYWQDGPSHLRTFYAWLFKQIRKEDLKYEGAFFDMTADLATMLPMIEMACKHFLFIPEILYEYNDMNPVSDHIVDARLQRSIDLHIRSLPVYPTISHSPLKRP